MKKTFAIIFGIILALTILAQPLVAQTGNFSTLRVYNLHGYIKAKNDTLAVAFDKIPAEDIEGISAAYTGQSPTTLTIGGLSAGTDIADSSFSYILEKILTPYQPPSFSGFTITGQSSTLEVGSTVSGTKDFAFSFTNSGNVQANTLDIYDVTGASYLITDGSITSPVSADVGTITKTTATSHSWRGYAENTESTQFQSSNYTINWRWRRYHGFSNVRAVNTAQVLALSGSELSTSKSYSTTTGSPTGDQYFVYAYPTSFGTLSSITVNGFPSIDAFTRFTLSVTNTNGVSTDYYVYYSNNTFNSSAEITYN